MSDKAAKVVAMATATEAVRQAMDAIGIYPAAVQGPNGYEERDAYKNGWNACAMDLSDKIGKAMEAVAPADGDASLALLTLAEVGYWTGERFLLNMNDTFYYACADCEEVPRADAGKAAGLFKRYGYDGLTYWVAERRGYDPTIPSAAEDVRRVREAERAREEESRKRQERWAAADAAKAKTAEDA